MITSKIPKKHSFLGVSVACKRPDHLKLCYWSHFSKLFCENEMCFFDPCVLLISTKFLKKSYKNRENSHKAPFL